MTRKWALHFVWNLAERNEKWSRLQAFIITTSYFVVDLSGWFIFYEFVLEKVILQWLHDDAVLQDLLSRITHTSICYKNLSQQLGSSKKKSSNPLLLSEFWTPDIIFPLLNNVRSHANYIQKKEDWIHDPHGHIGF